MNDFDRQKDKRGEWLRALITTIVGGVLAIAGSFFGLKLEPAHFLTSTETVIAAPADFDRLSVAEILNAARTLAFVDDLTETSVLKLSLEMKRGFDKVYPLLTEDDRRTIETLISSISSTAKTLLGAARKDRPKLRGALCNDLKKLEDSLRAAVFRSHRTPHESAARQSPPASEVTDNPNSCD